MDADRDSWEKWGPYVSERAWGTVREDYSADGNAWAYLTHDMARSKAFRWGEDAIAGICDRYQVMVFAPAFWNGKDDILKERHFGLGTWEGNHGEDVKEVYYHLDNVPSHAYMKYLYKYPMAKYPYEDLIEENKRRTVHDREYELWDTGILDEGRYFDIFIEYAKESQEDLCIKIEAFNRSEQEGLLHIIPQLWFRNAWSWHQHHGPEPVIKKGEGCSVIADDRNADPVPRITETYYLGERHLYATEGAEILFTNNETNKQAVFGAKSLSPYTKDAFHRHIVNGEHTVNPNGVGTKCCFHYRDLVVPAGESVTILLRLSPEKLSHPLDDVEHIIAKRKKEADHFYDKIHPPEASEDENLIQRQALSGMLWNKQIYLYDVNLWLKGDNPDRPPPPERAHIRNTHWKHMISKRILSMPDKWEYPWFAAWDLSFHCIPLALVDAKLAKDQLWYLLFDQFQHPNGQVPAYEWEFSELNPPVQAWAAYRIFRMEYESTGERDLSFLKRSFHKLLLNFVWWVNKVDSKGNNVFEGGFLGLDNITVIDRSMEIPGGGTLEQSDGTGWMGLFCLMLMRISLEIGRTDHDYQMLALKFFEHFVYIANALMNAENRDLQLWDEDDGFFYDMLCNGDGTHQKIEVRSLVGLIPMYAVDLLTFEEIEACQDFGKSFHWFSDNRQDLTKSCVHHVEGKGYMLTLMTKCQMERILQRAWDINEFRSEYGLRSLSKYYQQYPYELLGNSISYEPGEGESSLKGGNSNWRGPIWFPTSFLFIEALNKIYDILGDSFKVNGLTAKEMADTYACSMVKLFLRDEGGRRPVFGDSELFQTDPHFKDYILFYEHFHGDTGRGLGASHQCGWTGLVANLINEHHQQSQARENLD
ncbi:MAG: hypothetical protein SP1CHLAM54_07830 [Chlamydiia bacterium]|nr:hypothetical protein [Chlamydiia bacterium]MCH9615689.1 hypothetical protein [Chlamydiia bacterium]MCH9628908.1 hypothetical protein [Chlamydiia bacterium]